MTKQSADRIKHAPPDQLSGMADESQQLIVISTGFETACKKRARLPENYQLSASAQRMIRQCAHLLRPGGLLFVYGEPYELAFWGERLASMRETPGPLVFKYWIALDIDDAPASRFLKPAHLGLLLFMKDRPGKKTPAPFHLNADAIRIPHAYCTACGQNLKDWGGKKHLMNPRGAAPSDVWGDLPRRPIRDGVIPDDVMERVLALAGAEGEWCSHITVQNRASFKSAGGSKPLTPTKAVSAAGERKELRCIEANQVYLGDCVSFLKKVEACHPQGMFELVFADPPYNLEKGYNHYDDALAERHYIEWCNTWLEGMARTLRPGGSLFVLNLPKWAIHHATFLSRHLEFRHWIAWDALSDPRGKLMPAHYALLYYTKPGGTPVFNYSPVGRPKEDFVPPPDSPKYCLRAGCIKGRKRVGDDAKVELSDIWFDIHRIKHKRDRDAHPCQLPEKLLERIIKLTTQPGGLVFDPFCGAGTTAIAAAKLGRRFVVVDMDPHYVRITKEKLAALKQNTDLFGAPVVPRNSVARPRAAGSKRGIELYLQNLARKLGRVPTEDDVVGDQPEILRQIDLTYATRGAAFKRAKVVLGSAA